MMARLSQEDMVSVFAPRSVVERLLKDTEAKAIRYLVNGAMSKSPSRMAGYEADAEWAAEYAVYLREALDGRVGGEGIDL